MIYKIVDGRRVCKEGPVIIENIRHYIKNGYVCCNESLNSRAWNITEEKSICEECLKIIRPIQQNLFINSDKLK